VLMVAVRQVAVRRMVEGNADGDFNPIQPYFSDYASLAQSHMVCGQVKHRYSEVRRECRCKKSP